MNQSEELRQRFWDKVIPVTHSGCWIWLGADDGRYGQISVGGKTQKAHRVSYEMHVGPIEQGMLVCHKCDIGFCVNPDHLFVGSMADNMNDAARKGRTGMQRHPERTSLKWATKVFRGEEHGCAKLNKDDVLRIRAMALQGFSEKQIGENFNISGGHAGQIIRRKKWKHI